MVVTATVAEVEAAALVGKTALQSSRGKHTRLLLAQAGTMRVAAIRISSAFAQSLAEAAQRGQTTVTAAAPALRGRGAHIQVTAVALVARVCAAVTAPQAAGAARVGIAGQVAAKTFLAMLSLIAVTARRGPQAVALQARAVSQTAVAA